MKGRSSTDSSKTGPLESVTDGRLTVDREGTCTAIDDGALATFDETRGALVGREVFSLLCRRPNSVRRKLRNAIDDGVPSSITVRTPSSDRPGADGRTVYGWIVPEETEATVLLVDPETRRENAETSCEEDSTVDGPDKRGLLEQTERLARTGGWEFDLETEQLFWTRETRRIHGVDKRYEPTLEDALSFYHPDDRDAIETAVERAVEQGERYDLTARIQPSAGEWKWVRTIGEPVTVNGERNVIRGAIRDVTPETKLDRDLALLRRAVDSAPVGITIRDATREGEPLVYANEAFADLTGYDVEEAIGRSCRFLQGEGTDPETVSAIRDALDQNAPIRTEIKNYREDGSAFWNRLTIAPIGTDDTVTHFVGFQEDVTERKETEQRRRQFERAVEHAGHAIYITDRDGHIEYVNDSFVELTGYERSEIYGKTPNVLNSGDMPRSYFERLWETILAGETFEERIVDEGKSGHRYHAHQTIAPLIDEDDDVTGFVAIQSDITAKIEREQRIAVLDRVLRHNIRNDMNTVLGHAEMIAEETSGPLAESARTIETTARDLVTLAEKERRVAQLLSEEPARHTRRIAPLVDAAVERIESAYPDADVSVVTGPSPVSVVGSDHLTDALVELLENAIVHAECDRPTVEIQVESNADTVTISVIDEGPGIPTTAEELFSTEMLPDSLSHQEGIGLWFVHWFVSRAGGSLEFDDHESRGAVVSIELPRA
ncbi:PAS domain S-box protein [Natrarchaeobius chitinivorans]|uniref:PAS domain S-box protein n=1 Tax=Natrarchaeobius chitinivorans TaxID=1679083 RepID=A0A3N6NEF9_NATCH|nr:PAS domain S-box protein [Natrarchaeobius chitinivorans]RQG97262.1 PAS domain S-box protein [Natrarchaeobius chitinivorans]